MSYNKFSDYYSDDDNELSNDDNEHSDDDNEPSDDDNEHFDFYLIKDDDDIFVSYKEIEYDRLMNKLNMELKYNREKNNVILHY